MKITGYLVPLLAVIGAIFVGFSIPFIISGITSEGRRELITLQASGTPESVVATLNAIGAQTGAAFLQTIYTPTLAPQATSTLNPATTLTSAPLFIPLSGATSTPSNTPTPTRTRWIPSRTPTEERHSNPPPGVFPTATAIPPSNTPIPPTTEPPPPTTEPPPPTTEPPPPNTEPPPPNTEPPPPTEPPAPTPPPVVP